MEIKENKQDPFEKVIGYESLKNELRRIADIVKSPEKYSNLGVSIPQGVVLVGRPGVGKTLMATCIAEATGRKYKICRKNLIGDKFIEKINEHFRNAIANEPSVLILDDLDKYGQDEHSGEYATVQACIENLKSHDVFIIATANKLDNIPESLTRYGRFDKMFQIFVSNGKAQRDIVEYFLSKKKHISNMDFEEVARLFAGCTCAEIESMINDAGIIAGYENCKEIEYKHIVLAVLKNMWVSAESLSAEQNAHIRQIAIHEAGHAVVSELFNPGSVSVVSILPPNSQEGGVTISIRPESYWFDVKYMQWEVIQLLAGKAATEIVFGKLDVGCDEDIINAREILSRFYEMYQMYGFQHPGSAFVTEEEKNKRNNIIQHELGKYYKSALENLTGNKKFLEAIADELVEKKTIVKEDIQRIKKEIYCE